MGNLSVALVLQQCIAQGAPDLVPSFSSGGLPRSTGQAMHGRGCDIHCSVFFLAT